MQIPASVFLIGAGCFLLQAHAQDCVECHTQVTPAIVSDWKLSKHAQNSLGCTTCHGDQHKSRDDVAKVRLPKPETCGLCHSRQFEQFSKGKHARAWTAMKAMPTIHWQPMAMVEGKKGCGGCHKIGLKTQEEIKELQKEEAGFGLASCDGCHTRHIFSVEEARQPQACQTCHMGFDHPQWEMYSSSKPGIRYLMKQLKILPDTVAAPRCQFCHLPEGNHANRTAWGFLAVRLPLPADKQWAEDRTTILRALGVLDAQGKPTPRLEAIKRADMVRFTQEDWQKERDKMVKACSWCHATAFVTKELGRADQMIKEADHLMAQAIMIVARLYEDAILEKPASYNSAFPDLLTFHDAPSSIEQKLFRMFSEYRMRTFQGAFHTNPDYAFWYGWSALRSSLTEMQEMDRQLRKAASKH